MRLKLTLRSEGKLFPLNYNYFVSSAIYKLLRFGSPEFTSFLHDIGFVLNGKPYKLFTFALRFLDVQIAGNYFSMNSSKSFLFISSPLVEEFIKNFVIGTFENRFIEIADGKYKCRWVVEHVESLPNPAINESCYVRLLSPIVLSNVERKDEIKTQHFLRFNDDISEINRVLNQNLKNKYKLVYNSDYKDKDVTLAWDDKYIQKKISEGKRPTKKISVMKKDIRPVEIIANDVPFTLTGGKELIRIGYECGFGEKNSMGFGMGEII